MGAMRKPNNAVGIVNAIVTSQNTSRAISIIIDTGFMRPVWIAWRNWNRVNYKQIQKRKNVRHYYTCARNSRISQCSTWMHSPTFCRLQGLWRHSSNRYCHWYLDAVILLQESSGNETRLTDEEREEEDSDACRDSKLERSVTIDSSSEWFFLGWSGKDDVVVLVFFLSVLTTKVCYSSWIGWIAARSKIRGNVDNQWWSSAENAIDKAPSFGPVTLKSTSRSKLMKFL